MGTSTPARQPARLAVATAEQPVLRAGAASARLRFHSVWALVLLHYVSLGLYALIWTAALHGALPRRREDDPGAHEAVGFLFVPGFNLYWIFFVYRRLCLRLDEQRVACGLHAVNLGGLATACCVVMLIPFVNLLLGLGVLVPLLAGRIQNAVNELVMRNMESAT